MSDQEQDYSQLSDEELDAAAYAEDTDVATVGEEGATTQADTSDQDPQQQQQQAPDWNPEGPGNIREALRQERDMRRQYEAQVAQYQQQLAQYQLSQQQAYQQEQYQPEPPDPWDDPGAFTDWKIQQSLAPIQEQLQGANSYIQQLEYERELLTLGRQYPEAPDVVMAIDREMPHLRDLPAEAKYYLWRGAQQTSPEAQQRLVEERAQKLAAEMVAKQFPSKSPPPSIGHAASGTTQPPAPFNPRTASDEELARRARGE